MKKLIIFNQDYPYGHMEDSFLGFELPALKEAFDVTMVALEMRDESLENAEKQMFVISPVNSLSQKLKTIPATLFSGVFWKEIFKIIKTRKNVFGRCLDALMYMVAANAFYAKAVRRLGLNKDTEAIFYFYWFDYRCLAFAMHMNKYPKCRLVSRTHGYELYDIRERYGLQLYKEYMDSKLDRLVFAAEYARNYYLNRYGYSLCEKYPLHRLGVIDRGITYESRRDAVNKYMSENDEFVLISCSGAIDIKRVDLILSGLVKVTNSSRKIHWIHVGDGDKLEALKEEAAKKLGNSTDITYEFAGFVDNDKLMKMYSDRCMGAFITTTSTEGGSPVSIQEAMSFGIPIIGTAVGEIPIMLRNCGVVLSENPTAKEVGTAIADMAKLYGTEDYFTLCNNAIDTYKAMFDINQNNKGMVEELCALTGI